MERAKKELGYDPMVSAAKRIDLSLTYMKQCAAAIGNDDDAK
jgi:hypothetical protein